MEVYCPHCKEYHNMEEVKFLNIEEDMQGRDVVTFFCPIAEETAKSNVFGP